MFPITQATTAKPHPADDTLQFGRVFTDHMFMMEYDDGRGWHSGRIVPYGPLTLDPACCVLHYAQAVFDGLKAFRGSDGQVRLFRVDQHAARLNRSCEQLCIPPLDQQMVEDSIAEIVAADSEWVPRTRGTSLYIRPTVIATENFIGVHPSHSYLYYVILSPVGSYYREGLNPVRIMVSEDHVRAVPGGLGSAKTAGNYAASLSAARDAERAGFTQVLYLDGREREFLDEVGTMNIMLRIGDRVLTPPLSSGSILAGVTRDSALRLLADWGIQTEERPISIHEVVDAHKSGQLHEMWGTGTAAVIAPVGELGYAGNRMSINDGKIGELTQKLYDTVTAIQYGETNDTHNWTRRVA